MFNQSPMGTVRGIFPTPVYIAKRDLEFSPKEDTDIKDIIKEGMNKNQNNATSVNTYIFNSKLQEIKQFCEQQIKIYVKEIITPAEDLDFYITQSWLNINKPGEFHHGHAHANSIISGVFYVSTEEDDEISFEDPNVRIKDMIKITPKKFQIWNCSIWNLSVNTNELILFPSWLNHMVLPNEKATTNRISISFNTYTRGTLGKREELSELILK